MADNVNPPPEPTGGNTPPEGGAPQTPAQSVPEGHVLVPQAVLADIQARAEASQAKPTGALKEAIVVSDGYQYIQRDPRDNTRTLDASLAVRGQKIKVSSDELERGRRLGVLGNEEDLHAAEMQALAAGGGLPDDGALARMSPPEVLGYLANHTEDLDRVEELEKRRGDSKRPQVMRAIEVTREINGQLEPAQ